MLINLGLSVVFTLLFALLPRQLISMITPIEQTVNIGRQVLGAYIYAIPFAGVGMIMMNSLQAMGKALPAFIVSISRQGLAYIPALLLLNKFFGFDGLIFALPLADTFTTLLAGIFVIIILSRLKHQEPAPSSRQYIQAVPADEA